MDETSKSLYQLSFFVGKTNKLQASHKNVHASYLQKYDIFIVVSITTSEMAIGHCCNTASAYDCTIFQSLYACFIFTFLIRSYNKVKIESKCSMAIPRPL